MHAENPEPVYDPDSRKRRFVEAVQVQHWAPARELVRRLDEAGYWDPSLTAHALDQFKLSHVRRMVRKIKDESGWPVVASIELVQPDGGKLRVYMPEALFDMDEYRQVIGYWRDRAHYSIEMANGYTRRAQHRYGEQLPLPFPETD